MTKDKNTTRVQRCAAQHFGPWCVHPQWFAQAIAAVKAGTFKPDHQAVKADDGDMPGDGVEYELDVDGRIKILYSIENGIAIVPMSGQVTKGDSSFGGFSSVRARRAVRKASNDPNAKAILLYIDSPGGTVAGTGDLAGDISAADQVKPCYTYFEDLGASAAYWIGCQSRKCFANPTAEIGSIGTMTYVEDTSGAYEKAGIKVTLIATGKYKGQWVDGNPVSDDYIESVRAEVNDLNEHFLQGVMKGRGMSRDVLSSVADGRVFIADKAKQLGLIDSVSTFDAAISAIQMEIGKMAITREQFSAHAAENPQAAEVQALVNQGHEKGKAEANRPATVQELEVLMPANSGFVLAQLKAHATLAVASAAAVALMSTQAAAAETQRAADLKAQKEASDAEIAKLTKERDQAVFVASGQKPIATGAASKELEKEGKAPVALEQPDDDAPEEDKKAWAKASAEAEWEANAKDCKKRFSSKDRYVAYRSAELTGRHKTLTKA